MNNDLHTPDTHVRLHPLDKGEEGGGGKGNCFKIINENNQAGGIPPHHTRNFKNWVYTIILIIINIFWVLLFKQS